MSELFDKSIRTLELPAVLAMLADQTNSAEARERALATSPRTAVDEVERLQGETDAAREMIGLRGSPAFSGIKPVGESLYRADRGGTLNTRELLDIAGVLRCARRVKEYWNDDGGERTAVDSLFRSLRGNRFLEEKITTSILEEDVIADNASPELADIRRFLPMHQWGDFAFTEQFLAACPQFRDRTVPVVRQGQQFTWE